MVRVLFLVMMLGLTAIWSVPVDAGLTLSPGETAADSSAPELLKEKLFPGITQQFWALPDLVERVSAKTCDEAIKGKTYAVVIGFNGIDDFAALGSTNDANLFSGALESFGLATDQITVLSGETASRSELTKAYSELVDRVNCQDRIILFYSGFGMTFDMLQHVAQDHGLGGLQTEDGTQPGPFLLLVRETQDEAGTLPVLSAQALANMVMVLRNIGADVTVILDAMSIDGLDLIERHNRSDPRYIWRDEALIDARTFENAPELASSEEQLERADRRAKDALTSLATRPVPFAGAVTVIRPTEVSLEAEFNDGKTYGLVSYFLTSALAGDPDLTPRKAAAALREFKMQDHTDTAAALPVKIQSTTPDLPILAEAKGPDRSEAIRILEPEQTRGAFEIEDNKVLVKGWIEWPRAPLVVMVGKERAKLRAGGAFDLELDLQPGLNEIEVLAVTEDFQQHRTVFAVSHDNTEKLLLGSGKRYAVLIANQEYGGETGMARLATPLADIQALAAVLSEQYGFETEVTAGDGRVLPLVLTEASSRDVQLALYELSRIANPSDTILVYYAGHGIYEQRTGNAYWVLSDAITGVPPTFLSADAITDAITRFEATNVLVVSDSCYSGALTRSGLENMPDMSLDRLTTLQKLAKRRSRILISSGGEEPVADNGGGGHSVFARALLDGLQNMDENAFSARELFNQFLLPRVVSKSNQEPQYRPVTGAGHEAGDFIFVRAQSQN